MEEQERCVSPEHLPSEISDGVAARSLVLGDVAIKLEAIQAGLRRGCDDVTGFELWQHATAAACKVLPEVLEKLRPGPAVLELGCGLGALGIFCAQSGASLVLLTDKELPVLHLAVRNAAANSIATAARCDAVAYDFTQGRPPWRPGAFDLVVASDVLFLDRLARPLHATFEALSGSCSSARGMTSVLGHEVRRAVYRGPDGEPCVEPEDSALQEFLQAAGPRAHVRKSSAEDVKDQSHQVFPSLDGATRAIVLRGLLAGMLAAHAICQPGWLQSAKSLLKRCLSRSTDVDGDSVRVDAMMGQLKVSNAKAAVAIFMHVMPPLSLFAACVSYLFQSDSPLHDSASHFHMILLGYATAGVATAMQESMPPRSCELGMVFMNIACAIVTMACVPADHWFVASPIRLAVRILIGIGSMNHRHVALLNLAYIASYGYGNFASAQQVPGMQAGYGTVADCVLPEVVTSVLAWAILYFVESEVKKSLRASIHVESAQSEISAFQAMLNIFCDAQAELDGDLRILSSDSKLNRLLRTTEELQKVQLVNYVADSDKPRVLDLIKKSNTQLASSSDPVAVLHSTAHMLHAQMLSASGGPFGVQIFHVCRRDIHGSLRHLIGFCDELRRPPEEIDEHFIQASKAAWESKKQEEQAFFLVRFFLECVGKKAGHATSSENQMDFPLKSAHSY
ncbi:unnamed protein product, partial [Polarella glacialis]